MLFDTMTLNIILYTRPTHKCKMSVISDISEELLLSSVTLLKVI